MVNFKDEVLWLLNKCGGLVNSIGKESEAPQDTRYPPIGHLIYGMIGHVLAEGDLFSLFPVWMKGPKDEP